MINFFKKYLEPKKWLRMVETGVVVLLCLASIISVGYLYKVLK